jgi:hypothetical protein
MILSNDEFVWVHRMASSDSCFHYKSKQGKFAGTLSGYHLLDTLTVKDVSAPHQSLGKGTIRLLHPSLFL